MGKVAIETGFILGLDLLMTTSLIPLLPSFQERWNVGNTSVGVLLALCPLLSLLLRPIYSFLYRKIPSRRWLLCAGAFISLMASICFMFTSSQLALFLSRGLQALAHSCFWNLILPPFFDSLTFISHLQKSKSENNPTHLNNDDYRQHQHHQQQQEEVEEIIIK